ncbi:hypothetical protein GCM10023323_16630 [Streptomyces thinghirensis]|uniref:Uncharacterized protein n=1 Tax=Streptomyces thinghirensis TaxID=551547 RepID=A0ABP9SXV1_9ACTN
MATATAPYESGILPDETVDSVVIGGGAGLKDTRARFAARDVRVVDTPVQEVVGTEPAVWQEFARPAGRSSNVASWPAPRGCTTVPKAWTG